MKQYYVSKGGTQQGPFPHSRLAQLVASGELSRDDLCWTEGAAAWQPIHTVLGGQKNRRMLIGCSAAAIIVSLVVLIVAGVALRQWTRETARGGILTGVGGKSSGAAARTKRYESNGLSFSHHDNWEIEDKVLAGNARQVNVEGDGHSVFMIIIFPPEVPVSLSDFAANIEKEMPSNIPLGKLTKAKVTEITRSINGTPSTGISHKYSIVLLGQDVPHTQEFFLVETEAGNVITMIQAPDEDWHQSEAGFQLIFDTLRFTR